jgi:hypothetical protein
MPFVFTNLNDSNPAAPLGHRNDKWQVGPVYTDSQGRRVRDASDYLPNAWGTIATQTGNYAVQQDDSGKLLPCNGTLTVTLPTGGSPIQPAMWGSPLVQDPDWWIIIENIGSGTVTINGGGCNLDLSGGTLTLAQNQGVLIRVSHDGTQWQTFRGMGSGSGGTPVRTVSLTIDGGGSTPATGFKGSIQFPVAGTIIGWSIEADQAGSCSIDVAKHAGTQTAPVVPAFPGDKISATAPIALNSQQAAGAGASGVSTWTTAIAQWDSLAFQLTSVTTCTRITLWILIQP